jgi:tetratricopeptide (TPR) repeat protein
VLLAGPIMGTGRPRPVARDEGVAAPRAGQRRRAGVWFWVAAAVMAVAAGATAVIWQPWRKPEIPASGPTPPVAEARQLVQQALTLLRGVNVVRADLETAGQLFEKAKALDPTDGEVWAVGAMIDEGFVARGYDSSDTRKGEARIKAARALKLAPHSFEARLAQAAVLNTVVNEPSVRPETEQLIKSLLAEKPDDRWALIEKGRLLWTEGHLDEALACYRRANDPISEGKAYLSMGRLDEAEKAANRAISSGYSLPGLMLKASMELKTREDLDAAQAAIDQLPTSELLEERTASFAANLRLMRREPDKALAIMRALPQDWIPWGDTIWPKEEWTGFMQFWAGRVPAAQADWRAALRKLDERPAARPNDPTVLRMKALYLGCLGEYDEAQRNMRLSQQLQGQREDEITLAADPFFIFVYVYPKRRDEIVDILATSPGSEPHWWLRYHPLLDPLRGNPRFEKLLRDTLPKGAKPFDDQKPATSPAPEAKK